MPEVYLETSFVSACVTDRKDPKSIYRREESLEWWESQRMRHLLHFSDEVIAELSHPTYRRRRAAGELVRGIPSLAINDDAIGFAKILVAEKVMPAPLAGDALHVALASVHEMEYVLTWNVRHLANPNKTRHFGEICMPMGLIPPRIVTPDLLWEPDDEQG